MTRQKIIKTAWVDLLICLFLGIYGVHKFREKKIGLGVLYLCTGGVFFFGWFYDCTKLLVIAICTTLYYQKHTEDTDLEGITTGIYNFQTFAKKIALIVLIGFVLFFVFIAACSPSVDTIDDNGISNTVNTTVDSITDTTEPTTSNSSVETTNEPTTKPTTESNADPTSAPTTAPTTAPTAEPTTAPTIESTTTPTTEQSTPPSDDSDSSYTNGTTVYRTPTGKRYHFDPNCGGENSAQTTIEQAKNAGLTPCKKCAS